MVPVAVSKHACARMRERFPTIRDPESTANREVTAGIQAGRRSKTRPAWASTYKQPKARHSTRYVWNENLSRCYITIEKRMHGSRGILVVTVMGRGEGNLGLMHLVVPERTKGPHSPMSLRRPRMEES